MISYPTHSKLASRSRHVQHEKRNVDALRARSFSMRTRNLRRVRTCIETVMTLNPFYGTKALKDGKLVDKTILL